MANYCILVADNDDLWRQTLCELLKEAGYTVHGAANPEQARELLTSVRVHLAIVDWRLTNDLETDRSGLKLIRDCAPAITKIVLTGYSSARDATDALRGQNGSAKASHYLEKDNYIDEAGITRLLREIKDVLDESVGINWELIIRWSDQSDSSGIVSLSSLVSRIAPGIGGEQLPERTEELRDLLRRLFAGQDEIIIGRVVAELPGQALLAVSAFRQQSFSGEYLVVCGQRAIVELSAAHFDKLHTVTAMRWERLVANEPFAAAALVLNTASNQIVTFRECYNRMTGDELRLLMSTLFNDTLRPRYQREPTSQASSELARAYRAWLTVPNLPLPNADDFKQSVCTIVNSFGNLNLGDAQLRLSKDRLTLRHVAEKDVLFSIPLNVAFNGEQLTRRSSELSALTHGQMHPDAILVDESRNLLWFWDYSLIERTPILRDYVLMETEIKVHLLRLPRLEDRYRFEERLNNVSKLSVPLDTRDCTPEMKKALQAIGHIRYLASQLNPDVDLQTYRVSLLFATIHQILRFQPGRYYEPMRVVSGAHCLLSAAMLYQALQKPQVGSSAALPSFELKPDENAVVINEHVIQLSATEYKTMALLYEHRKKLCSHLQIARDVLGLPVHSIADLRQFEQTYYPHMSRLRQKLQPSPRVPKVLHTVHGRGYRLEI